MRSVILDTETTGLLRPVSAALELQPYVIDIGFLIVEDGQIVKEYSQLVKPPVEVSKKITKLTGITNEMLEEAPSFKDVEQEVSGLLLSCGVLFAHNAYFDVTVLGNEYKRLGKQPAIPNKVICTVEEYKNLFGYNPKLTELYEFVLGKPLNERHRALSDAQDLYEILREVQLV